MMKSLGLYRLKKGFLTLSTLVVFFLHQQLTQAACPPIGTQNASLHMDRTSSLLTLGQGVECCLHTLSVNVRYRLEAGDEVDVHGAIILNDSNNTISGITTLSILVFGHEQAYAHVRGSVTFGLPGVSTRVRLMVSESGTAQLGGSCAGDGGGYSAHDCNGPNFMTLGNASVSMRLKFGASSLIDEPDIGKGLLWSKEEVPSRWLTTPKTLNYSKNPDSLVDVVRNADHSLRQIRAEDGLVDIVPIDAFGYGIRLYASQSQDLTVNTMKPMHHLFILGRSTIQIETLPITVYVSKSKPKDLERILPPLSANISGTQSIKPGL